MNREDERELDVVLGEEKAKTVLGADYATAPFDQWVNSLRAFVVTQRCDDCGARYDLDDPELEMWGWSYGASGEGADIEELEVAQFFCERCTDLTPDEREANHERTWGVLIFRRRPTGTFPFGDDEVENSDDKDEGSGEVDDR